VCEREREIERFPSEEKKKKKGVVSKYEKEEKSH